MSLVPYFKDNALVDGEFLNLLSFCKDHFKGRKCVNHYEHIKNGGETGFSICPYGFSSYLCADTNTIYTGMREENIYKRRSIKNPDKKTYNPVLSKEQIMCLIKENENIISKEKQLAEKKAVVESISHEVKKLNAQIKEHSEYVLQELNLIDDEIIKLSQEDISRIAAEIKTVFLSSSMINSRFSLLDYERNPHVLMQGSSFDCGVYKKFDKVRKIFKNYKNKGVPIIMKGTSYAQIKAYPSFELIPLLIIENAVKYTLDRSHNVEIEFIECSSPKELIITVTSYSPYCSTEELSHIFEKGYRGRNAKKVSSDGQGVGLYFVKLLCGVHSIAISANSDQSRIKQYNSVPYAHFRITLRIPNIYSC